MAIFKKMNRGQSSAEYVMLLIIIIGSYIAMSNYVKRGLQGRWRESVDGLGDQYDPRTAITNIRHRLSSSTNTTIVAMNTAGGYWTKRTDESISTERKTGSTMTGAY